MRRPLFLLLTLGALVSVPVPARAQQQDGSSSLADSLVGRGDSVGALRALDDAVRANGQDAAAWHQRGVIAWSLSGAEKRTGFMKRQANDSLLELADSSLRLATRYDADRPVYLVDLGRFYLTSNSAGTRGKAPGLFEKALKIARKTGDSVGISLAADEVGMSWWRHYEDRADRHIYSVIIGTVQNRKFLSDPRAIAYFVDNETIRAAAQDWSGQYEYLNATERFAEALGANANNTRALKHVAMAMVDRKRWPELEHVARVRLLQDPKDAWGWATYGLALHRQEDEHDASAAFDSALKYLPASERARIDRLSRIVTPKDSVQRSRLPDSEQGNDERMYWLMADPLWATPDNEHRLEFLSRVTYAELRWSVEEFGLHGVDTDRGEVYVRYGPPPAIISFPADPARHAESRIQVLWWYSTDEAFLFRQLPTYRVATLDVDDARELRRLRDTVPVVWGRAGHPEFTDTIGVQLVHFRATHDSSDVFVAASVPVDRLVRGIDLARGMIDIDFRAFTWRAEPLYEKSMNEVVDFTKPNPREIRAWRTRMRPGAFLYRVEALQPDAGRGARAASRIELKEEHGFGLSDLMVAEMVAPKASTGGDRWSDFLITPNLGVVRRGQSFALLWETYDLGAADGNDRYRVNVTVQRAKGSGGDFAAKITGGVRSAVGLSGTGQDKVTLSFTRQVPSKPVNVDYVTVDMGTTPPVGTYLVTVDVADLVTNQHTSQSSAVTIIE